MVREFFEALIKAAVDYGTLSRAAGKIPHFKTPLPGAGGPVYSKYPHTTSSGRIFKPGIYVSHKGTDRFPKMVTRIGATARASMTEGHTRMQHQLWTAKGLIGPQHPDHVASIGKKVSTAIDKNLDRRKHFDRFAAKTDKGRRAIRHSIVLHEARERHEAQKKGFKRFLGHNTAKPPLQDLNIAATYKGPEKTRVSQNIRAMRAGDIKHLANKIPDVKKLHLGKKRISRHAMRRIEELRTRK